MAIELKHITKKYDKVVALNDVSLAVGDGEFVTLLGPSGCGKTTLLKIVAGFIQPDHGEVFIDGNFVNQLAPNRRPTGMVFQSYALFPHMTVRKNISFGLHMRRATKTEVDEKVKKVAQITGIESLLDRYPSQISGGQQQRVALARTLAVEPSALLLDEPLAALDRKLRVEMRTELRKLIDQVGITTLFVTHDQEEALTMSDRIAVMDHGVIVQYGTPMEIYDDPQSTFVARFVGNSNLFHGKVRKDLEDGFIFEGEGILFSTPPDFGQYEHQSINIMFRPEHLQLGPFLDDMPADKHSMVGTVTYMTHLGVSIEYEVRLDTGALLRLEVRRLRNQNPYKLSTRVYVRPIDSTSYLVIP
jgi:ABC-type Fe3+/spermidine/putrescine transport system ATPase subunit